MVSANIMVRLVLHVCSDGVGHSAGVYINYSHYAGNRTIIDGAPGSKYMFYTLMLCFLT